jgi:hypothetical protein
MTGAIGIAEAFRRYEFAAVLAVLNLVTLRYANRPK